MSKDYTRNQHFVPRAYLRFFSYKKKNEYYVKVFDKKINKDYLSSVYGGVPVIQEDIILDKLNVNNK